MNKSLSDEDPQPMHTGFYEGDGLDNVLLNIPPVFDVCVFSKVETCHPQPKTRYGKLHNPGFCGN